MKRSIMKNLYKINYISLVILLVIASYNNVESKNVNEVLSESEVNLTTGGFKQQDIPDPTETNFYQECGKAKSCFGFPNDCVDTTSCKFAVSVTKDDNAYLFELISYQEEAAYVALALAEHEKMSETTLMECVKEANGRMKSYDSWLRARSVDRSASPQGLTTLIGSAINKKMFMCRIKRAAKTEVNEKTFDLDNDAFHLLIASGKSTTINGIGFHSLGFAASSKGVLGDAVQFKTATSILLKLHGIFMYLAWICTTSVGVIFARYYKTQFPKIKFMGKDLWFVQHQSLMICTWVFTMVAFALVFIEVQGWSFTKNPHPILGMITTVLCFFQPFLAMFRPNPSDKRRWMFNWIHFLMGNGAHLFGIISIVFAVSLPKAQLPFGTYYVIIAFVSYYIASHIILSIVTERESFIDDKNNCFMLIKKVFLSFHVIVILIFAVIGVAIMIKPTYFTSSESK